MISLSSHLKRYIAVGLSVYALELTAIILLQNLGASSVWAVAISFWIGLLLSFILQKIVAFKDRRKHHRIIVSQLLAFSALVLFNFGFTIIVTNLLQGIIPAFIIRTLAIGITTLWNFYLYKTRIFKNDNDIIIT